MDHFTLKLISLLTATALLLVLLRRRRRSSATTSPPSPPSLPVIGHLHLLTDTPHHSFARLAQSVGPIFSLRLGRVPTVVISSARHAALVLKTHDHVFASRPQLVSAQYLSFNCSDVTFSRYGPYWRQARKICVSELLSQKRVNSFRLIRDEETNRMLSQIRAGSENDVSKMVFAVANDVLCRVAFGRRFIREEGQKRHLFGVLAEAQELFGGFCVGDFFPEWGWVNSVTGFTSRCERNLKDLSEVCDEIIKEHLNKTTLSFDDHDRQDFVDVLLRVQKREDLDVPITDDNLKALVLDMFVAGTDTTSAVIEWTMTQLIRHPTVMRKAQEEIRKVASISSTITEADLQHLHYTKSVIKETMRLTPPVPLLVPRESMDDCVVDRYHIPAKTRVLINTYAIGRDPQSWDRPLQFDPDRFSGHKMDFKEDQDFKFLPFGGGRRGCPGFNLGFATVELALARLLCHFDWALPDGVRVDDVNLDEIFGLAIRKKTPLILVPTVNKDFEFKGIDA